MPVSNSIKEFKRCGRCKEKKPISCFGVVNGKARSYCRECHRSYNYIPEKKTEKRCPCCQQTKPVEDFNRLGIRCQGTCRECQNARSQLRNEAIKKSGLNIEINRRDYRERRKWIRLRSRYGLTKEIYQQMVEDQGNLCAICKKPETESSSPHIDEMDLSIDHCHTTGKVRGLLCRQCNIALGRFREDVTILESAIAYLKRSMQKGEV